MFILQVIKGQEFFLTTLLWAPGIELRQQATQENF